MVLRDYPDRGHILRLNKQNKTNLKVGRSDVMRHLVQPVDVSVIPRLARHLNISRK
ncbi:uncharacterized protein DS421_12g371630 [Arachis hypogaea]|nr:uncharacterized protein DS421_12g371630 [Arachis hypogaea]